MRPLPAVDLRLEVQAQLAVANGVAQLVFQLQLGAGGGVHVFVEEAAVRGAGALGRIQCLLGVPPQGLDRVGVAREERDADAGGEHQFAAVERQWSGNGFQQALGDQRGMAGETYVDQEDGECIAVDAGNRFGWAHRRMERQQVACPDRGFQAFGDFAEEAIARGVAKCIVDALEMIEIEMQERATPLCAARTCQFDLDQLGEELPIGQSGQAVVHGQMLDAPFRLHPLADVLGDAFDPDDPACGITDRLRLFEHFDQLAILTLHRVAQPVGRAIAQQCLPGDVNCLLVGGPHAAQEAFRGTRPGEFEVAKNTSQFVRTGKTRVAQRPLPVTHSRLSLGLRQAGLAAGYLGNGTAGAQGVAHAVA
jgi:hypothetical protein